MIKIAPSVLAADLSCLRDEIASCEDAGADLVHLDVMDGHFVPNISFGPKVCSDIRRITALDIEAHLMVQEPKNFIRAFAEAGASWVTLHAESRGLDEAMFLADSWNLRLGIALNPGTGLEAVQKHLEALDMVLVMTVEPGFAGQEFMPGPLSKIEALWELREREGLGFLLAVDGGVNLETAKQCVRAGADLLAVGSGFFGANDRRGFVRRLKALKPRR